MQPAGKVAHGGVDAHQGRLRQLLPLQRLQKGFGHRDEPFLGPIVLVEVLVEAEETLQVAAPSLQGGLRAPGGFSHQVDGSQLDQAVFCPLDMRPNVMGWIPWQNQDGIRIRDTAFCRGLWHRCFCPKIAYSSRNGGYTTDTLYHRQGRHARPRATRQAGGAWPLQTGYGRSGRQTRCWCQRPSPLC